MAKMYASDAAMQASIEGVQILGGYGYCKEYPMERHMRDAKITQIYEGTNEIMRVVIANNILKGKIGTRQGERLEARVLIPGYNLS